MDHDLKGVDCVKMFGNQCLEFHRLAGGRLWLACAAAAILAHAGDWKPLKQKIVNESGRARSFTLREHGAPTEMLIGYEVQTHLPGGGIQREIEPVLAGTMVTANPGQTLQLYLTPTREGGCLVYDFQDAAGMAEWGFELHVAPEPPKVWFQYASFPESKSRHGKVTLGEDLIIFHPDEAKASGDIPAAPAPGGGSPGQHPSPDSDSPAKSLPPSPPGASSGSDSDGLPQEIAAALAASLPGHADSPPRPGATVSPHVSSDGSAAASQQPSPDPGSAPASQFPSPAGGSPAQGSSPAPQGPDAASPPGGNGSGA
jgi:hypothetical protein